MQLLSCVVNGNTSLSVIPRLCRGFSSSFFQQLNRPCLDVKTIDKSLKRVTVSISVKIGLFLSSPGQ